MLEAKHSLVSITYLFEMSKRTCDTLVYYAQFLSIFYSLDMCQLLLSLPINKEL